MHRRWRGPAEFDSNCAGIHNDSSVLGAVATLRGDLTGALGVARAIEVFVVKFRQSHFSQRCEPPTPLGRVCFFVLLCLCVWRGPVPIIHEHALDLPSLSNNSQLAVHAIAHHADELGTESGGLHLHFILLSECSTALPLTASEGSSAPEAGVDFGMGDGLEAWFGTDRELLGQQEVAILDLHRSLEKRCFGEVRHVPEDLRFSSTADESFLQIPLCGAPACALLCVFLC